MHDGSEFEYIDQTASWHIEDRNTIAIVIEKSDLTKGTGFGIAEEDGRLILWSFLGDPDSWEFIEYKLQHAQATIHNTHFDVHNFFGGSVTDIRNTSLRRCS